MTHLEDIKNNVEINEKYRLETIARTEETKNIIADLDTASKTLKKQIEENLIELTNTKYSIIQFDN
jgi:5S rRNA maturation endonuclease (ribonuclease M5)